MSPLSLLKKKYFGPFFGTMGLGAFNDNLFKSALVMLITYRLTDTAMADILIQVAAGVFILPFFIFSGISGQICEREEKSSLIRKIKLLEIIIMCFGAIAFVTGNIYFSIFILFLMGTQSTLFGPVKYSILPQQLKSNELVQGNALVSMGTFIAILMGTTLGGLLVSDQVLEKFNTKIIAMAVIVSAVIGWIFSLKIPKALPSDPNLKVSLNPVKETWKTLKIGKVSKKVFLSILGISWFWFYGFFFIASLPSFCRDILQGDQVAATFLLTMISLGIGLGSIVLEKLAKGKIDLGLFLMGMIGLTVFAVDLSYTTSLWRAGFDLFMIGFSGGFYIVPLYTLMQRKSPKTFRSRVIASNNIYNALFMVSAALFAIVCFKLGLVIDQIFLLVAIINLLILIALYFFMSEYFFFLLVKLIVRTFYRINTKDLDNLPEGGGCLIVANHVSFMDPFIISSICNRPPRFIMDKWYYKLPVINFFCRQVKAIPIETPKRCLKDVTNSLDLVAKELEAGALVVIFPEGGITRTGELNKLKLGLLRILDRTPVPVIPIGLNGLWGSWFSRKRGAALKGLPPVLWRKVQINVGEVIASSEVSIDKLYTKILDLLVSNPKNK